MQTMATKRKKTEHRVIVDDDRFRDEFEALHDRMDKFEDLMNRFLEAMTEKPVVTGPGGERDRRRVKATPAQLHTLYLTKARQMRQGKAARRFGITRQEFVARFGDIDHMPRDVEPPKDLPKAKKTTKKKAKARSKKKTAKKK